MNKTNEVQLKVATRADAAEIARVYLASRRELLPFAPLAHDDDSIRSWMRDVVMVHCTVVVAVYGERVVGFSATIEREDSNWLDHLYLHPDFVRKGIGTLLLERVLADLDRPIQLFTFQQNVGARRFYERFGFEPIRFGDGSENEERCPDVLYRAP